MAESSLSRRFYRALASPPFTDELGRKGWLEGFTRAQPHEVRKVAMTLAGWPRWLNPIRILFLSDLHVGSHAGDIERFESIVAQAAAFNADLVLMGGDYVNMQPFGGGRVPPRLIAQMLSRLQAPCGCFAVLGNHDVMYGHEVGTALRDQGIFVLDDASAKVRFENCEFMIAGVPDAELDRPAARALVSSLAPDMPTIIVSHDPVWFAHVSSPSHLMLAGHTHGGQVRLPYFGAFTNQSRAPLRWSYGHIIERGCQLYVTSGLGTSVLPFRLGIAPEFVVLELNGE